MINSRFIILIFASLILTSVYEARAENWPNWRGPRGDGTSTETDLPLSWDSVTNVVWESPVPGTGYSSPIIWEDRLFITSALTGTHEKILLCYDSKSGQLLWQRTVLSSPFEIKHNDNSYASGTPATDGNLVYVSFLDGKNVVVAAYDFAGNRVWIQRPGKFYSPHGYSCSPVLYEDKVIINGNSQGNPFLAALSKTDGHTIWKISLENPSHSFSTPIFREMAGKMQLIILGNKEVASYNPDDGSKYWFVKGPSEDFCASPVYNEKHGLVLISSAWPKRILQAIRPDGKGDVTESHVVWQSTQGAYYVPSPVCTDDYLFTTMTNGRVHCIDVATGNILWVEDMGRQYSSAVYADGLVYMPNDEGLITVIKPGPAFTPVAGNRIGERMNASPAISNGNIYLRGAKHLFCIGNQL